MGCGASAVRDQPPQSGPVGSATQLARWKRNHPGQTKVVECPLPTSLPLKASDEKAPSEVDTNCGASSNDAYSNEAQSRPESRESQVLDGDAQLCAHELQCKRLRLLMSRAVVQAAQSGVLTDALQNSQPIRQLQVTSVVAPPGKPSPRKKRPGQKKTVPIAEDKLPTQTPKDSNDPEYIRTTAAQCLISAMESGVLPSVLAPMAKTEDDKVVQGIRQRAAQSLINAMESGVLESKLAPMAKTVDDKVVQGIRQRAAATLVKAAGTGSLQGAFTTLNNRQRIALDLQKAVENGTLEAAITKVFEDKKKSFSTEQ